MAPVAALAGADASVLVGADTGDDAGVLRFKDSSLVATVDFITPVCDDPQRFGRVAAANSISDVWAMGGKPLFALNLCCFPKEVPREALSGILEGGARAILDAGAVLLGGHTVADKELKFGLAVIGEADPERLITNAGATPGQKLILTKPVGTGVLINAYKKDRLDAAGLEPGLVEMERLNDVASRLALEHGVRGGTDVTGFGLAGHAWGIARSSAVALRIDIDAVPTYDAFAEVVRGGQSTGTTKGNRSNLDGRLEDRHGLDAVQQELLFDPQTSGGLLLATPAERAADLLQALLDTGHRAAEIGEVVEGPARIVVD
ncbi:MAG: selenide, water dikinase SelD [bacterium]|nr:selenide, water dikinase SelD [bacterium]